MKSAIVSLALFAGMSGLIDRVLRETNSNASVTRGIAQYRGERYPDAEASFRRAASIAPGATTSFDLGTAQIAAGNYAEGSATVAKAIADPQLRAAAYYNRGNSALAANALDHAIDDYRNALRIRSDDHEAKRNLEIALQRKDAQQQSGGGPSNEQQPDDRENPSGAPQEPDREGGDEEQSVESILRSVEQQEREELNRMRRSKAGPRTIGW